MRVGGSVRVRNKLAVQPRAATPTPRDARDAVRSGADGPTRAWSRADGCYFVPRCGASGGRAGGGDGRRRVRAVETAAVESDSAAGASGAPQTSKRRAALKPGAAFLLEDALASSAAGREDEDALACLRFARRGDDRSERDERGVEDASREPIENAIEVFEEEDDREEADRENAPDPPGRKPKRRRVRRKTSAEAARAALLRERTNGDDAFGS